jgi:hypothetical protein
VIRHVVLFKFKPEIEAVERADFVLRLKALPQQVAGILNPEVGADIVHSPRSHDVALVFGFPDREALDAYQTHPKHIPVIETARQICASIIAVDYEL